jgi:hypothetical protein
MHDENTPRRGFFFWALMPFLVVFILAMPLLIQKRDAAAWVTLSAVEGLAVLMLLGLFDSRRFWWAWRGVGAGVFLGYATYLIVMLMQGNEAIRLPERKSEASAFNALCGLVVFGGPGLWFAVTGRFPVPRRSEASDEEAQDACPRAAADPARRVD